MELIKDIIEISKADPDPDSVPGEEDELAYVEIVEYLRTGTLLISEELVIALLTDMREKLELGEMKARQNILQQTIKKIVVGHDRAQLHYQFPLKELNVGDWFMPPTGFEPVSQP